MYLRLDLTLQCFLHLQQYFLTRMIKARLRMTYSHGFKVWLRLARRIATKPRKPAVLPCVARVKEI